jgi:hypothetical protein
MSKVIEDASVPLAIQVPQSGPDRNRIITPAWLMRRAISHLCAMNQPSRVAASRPG